MPHTVFFLCRAAELATFVCVCVCLCVCVCVWWRTRLCARCDAVRLLVCSPLCSMYSQYDGVMESLCNNDVSCALLFLLFLFIPLFLFVLCFAVLGLCVCACAFVHWYILLSLFLCQAVSISSLCDDLLFLFSSLVV